MSAITPEVVNRVAKVAEREGIELAALLTVVEVEGAGRQYVEPADPKWPRFLFERHKFYDNLRSMGTTAQLTAAIAAGLAHKGWQRQTQYLDQGSSAGRIDLLRKAVAINSEAAFRSCSWGIGQVMGMNCGVCGFKSADAMVRHMAAEGLAGQIEVMARFMKSKGLVKKINAHDWTGFARAYNGAGYAQNQYDTKMRLAYPGWQARLDPGRPNVTTTPKLEAVADLPALQMEPVPDSMASSDISNGALLTTTSGLVGTLITLWEAAERIPDSFFQFVRYAASKPSLLIFVGIAAIGAYIYYHRYKKWRDAEA